MNTVLNNQLDTDSISNLGVYKVGWIFYKYGWKFHPLTTSDYGIDAIVEIHENKETTPHLFALQIKSGPSWFRRRGEDYAYYGTMKHYKYWSEYALPVFLILHNPETEETLWRQFDPREAQVTDSGWNIDIPRGNRLDSEAHTYLKQIMVAIESERQRVREILSQLPPSDNDDALASAIETLAQEDGNIRRRLLGYTVWLSPLPKLDLYDLLKKFHPDAQSIENNAQRLCDSGLLQDIGNYYLPNLLHENHKLIYGQAMASVQDEIIQFVMETAS